MNSSENHQRKSSRITNRTWIAPSSYVTTCQGTAGDVPSLSLKHLQAVPEIVLCPTLWRLSILKKRHRPPTTQAIKKPRPPSITIPAKAPLCTQGRAQPAACSHRLSRCNSRGFPSARQRPCEKAPKHTSLQPVWWQGKKIPFPPSQKKLAQRSQWRAGLGAVLWPVTGNRWSPSRRIVADEAISYPLSFLRYEKGLVIYLTHCWCALLTDGRNSELFPPPGRQSGIPFYLTWRAFAKWKVLLLSPILWPRHTDTRPCLLTWNSMGEQRHMPCFSFATLVMFPKLRVLKYYKVAKRKKVRSEKLS